MLFHTSLMSLILAGNLAAQLCMLSDDKAGFEGVKQRMRVVTCKLPQQAAAAAGSFQCSHFLKSITLLTACGSVNAPSVRALSTHHLV